jgi:hypothetical protein
MVLINDLQQLPTPPCDRMHDLNVMHPAEHVPFTAFHVFEWLEDAAEGCVAEADMQEDEDTEEALVGYLVRYVS